MKPGDVLTLLFDRDGFMVRTPSPYSEAAAHEHIDAINDPAVVARLSVVSLVVADARPAETREERAKRDTEPSPMSDAAFLALLRGPRGDEW